MLIREAVAKRDDYRCVLCDHLGIAVHEIKQRSGGGARAAHTFQKKYMASLCLDHHHDVHNTAKRNWLNGRMLIVLRSRHNYIYPPGLDDWLDRLSWYLSKHPIEEATKYA